MAPNIFKNLPLILPKNNCNQPFLVLNNYKKMITKTIFYNTLATGLKYSSMDKKNEDKISILVFIFKFISLWLLSKSTKLIEELKKTYVSFKIPSSFLSLSSISSNLVSYFNDEKQNELTVGLGLLNISYLSYKRFDLAKQISNNEKSLKKTETILDILKNNSDLNVFFSLLNKNENLINETLSMQNLILFAPTDKAFSKLPKSQLNYLQSEEGQEQLLKVLNYHIVNMEKQDSNKQISFKNDKLEMGKYQTENEGSFLFINEETKKKLLPLIEEILLEIGEISIDVIAIYEALKCLSLLGEFSDNISAGKGDIGYIRNASKSICRAACEKNPVCKSIVYDTEPFPNDPNPACFLKSDEISKSTLEPIISSDKKYFTSFDKPDLVERACEKSFLLAAGVIEIAYKVEKKLKKKITKNPKNFKAEYIVHNQNLNNSINANVLNNDDCSVIKSNNGFIILIDEVLIPTESPSPKPCPIPSIPSKPTFPSNIFDNCPIPKINLSQNNSQEVPYALFINQK